MDNPTHMPKLIIIGAGPGDPELITLKAYRILQKAVVVLYDNLANRQLLELLPPACEQIYVGKMPYGAYTPQETIHALIKEKAFEKGQVIRLKGGDPYIFGRGFEEVLFARSEGIEASYIPGITTMQAIGYEDIPLTHRNQSEGFWVMTGTKEDGTLSADLILAMQSRATVVIYMGMKKLPFIVETYINNGYGNTPAAVIQHATLPHKKTAKANIQTLPMLVQQQGITHPAIIVIGNVVNLADYAKTY